MEVFLVPISCKSHFCWKELGIEETDALGIEKETKERCEVFCVVVVFFCPKQA